MAGGVCGRKACMAVGIHGRGGHVWQGACMAGGVHGKRHAWQGGMCGGSGACVAGGVHATPPSPHTHKTFKSLV